MSEVTKKSDQQKGAEAEVESFRKDLGPFVVAAETTRMAMVFTDAKELDHPIDTQAFDAAMLDMNLDGNKSHEVADALAARGVPFVFSTGYSSLEMKDAYRDRPVLKKPYMYETLVEILTRLLPR